MRCPSVACPHLERGLYKLVVGVNAGLYPGPTTPNGTCAELLVTDKNNGTSCVSWRINCGPVGCLYDLEADETEHGASRATVAKLLPTRPCTHPWPTCKRAAKRSVGLTSASIATAVNIVAQRAVLARAMQRRLTELARTAYESPGSANIADIAIGGAIEWRGSWGPWEGVERLRLHSHGHHNRSAGCSA